MRCVAILLALSSGLFSAVVPRTALVPVTVVLQFEEKNHSVPLATVHGELQKLLTNANLDIDLRLSNDLEEHAQFGQS
jgi:hypothetical protein